MTDACCAIEHGGTPPTCPVTGRPTPPVGRQTLEALLPPWAKATLTPQPYYFCDSAECDIVYVSALGDHLVTKDQLTVRVGVKEKDDPAPLCYCFGYDRKTILDEVRAKGETDIPKMIAGRVKAGEGRCEATNPSGGCCLGSIHRAIRMAQSGAAPVVARQGLRFAIGGLVAGVLASVCCLGPAVLGALGLGTVVLGSGLEKFRPLFALATAGLLGAAFYFMDRKRAVVCEDGSCRAEFSPRATKIGLWIVAALAVGAFAFPYLRAPAKAPAAFDCPSCSAVVPQPGTPKKQP